MSQLLALWVLLGVVLLAAGGRGLVEVHLRHRAAEDRDYNSADAWLKTLRELRFDLIPERGIYEGKHRDVA